MRPKTPETTEQPDMFRETLEAILNPRHELLVLARQIDWERIDEVCGETFVADVGRPGLPTRLMAGLHILKHVRGVSDEVLTEGWVENGYWQAFCGERFFQHEAPFDRSSLTRWRQRMGAERLEVLLAETLRIAQESGAAKPLEMERVTVDTTVQSSRRPWPQCGRVSSEERGGASDRWAPDAPRSGAARCPGAPAWRGSAPVLRPGRTPRSAGGKPAALQPRPQAGPAASAEAADLSRPSHKGHRPQDRR